jgi:hypothetical protein
MMPALPPTADIEARQAMYSSVFSTGLGFDRVAEKTRQSNITYRRQSLRKKLRPVIGA